MYTSTIKIVSTLTTEVKPTLSKHLERYLAKSKHLTLTNIPKGVEILQKQRRKSLCKQVNIYLLMANLTNKVFTVVGNKLGIFADFVLFVVFSAVKLNELQSEQTF